MCLHRQRIAYFPEHGDVVGYLPRCMMSDTEAGFHLAASTAIFNVYSVPPKSFGNLNPLSA
jgi:hypothetical protein